MRIDVVTLFPEVFSPLIASSIVGRAVRRGLVRIRCIDLRGFATDRHHSVDDRPFGGGAGMVLMCGPVFDAVEHVERGYAGAKPVRILLTPQGETLTQGLVSALADEDRLLLICGHYDGFDERIHVGLGAREVSIGDYVLTGGEPAAMVLIDAVVRLLPGALGDAGSLEDESFTSGRLAYPQFTRPRSFRGMAVPDVLLSGDHGAIAAWRRAQATERTRVRRPDLMSAGSDCDGASG
ncbi:MAG: tRNA (guanosine(37)-N1)-methyltransferase TrmD [Phycisphaerae bacterium]